MNCYEYGAESILCAICLECNSTHIPTLFSACEYGKAKWWTYSNANRADTAAKLCRNSAELGVCIMPFAQEVYLERIANHCRGVAGISDRLRNGSGLQATTRPARAPRAPIPSQEHRCAGRTLPYIGAQTALCPRERDGYGCIAPADAGQLRFIFVLHVPSLAENRRNPVVPARPALHAPPASG